MGTFNSPPPPDITLTQLDSTFLLFDKHDDPSGSGGNFPSEQFSNLVGTTFASAKIYLVVTNSPTIAAATEFAVFSSTALTWVFPASEVAPSSAITLVGTVDQYFAGSADTILNPGPISGTRNSIKLESTSPPAPPLIPLLTSVIVGGKPGVEFDYPTAAAGTVSFALDESCTLLDEPSWSPVTSTPSVVGDNGTTQRIRMLHPDLLTSAPKRYFRVTVTAL